MKRLNTHATVRAAMKIAIAVRSEETVTVLSPSFQSSVFRIDMIVRAIVQIEGPHKSSAAERIVLLPWRRSHAAQPSLEHPERPFSAILRQRDSLSYRWR